MHGTRRLTTRRLLLRPFAAGDAPAMFRTWASDEETVRFLRWSAHRDEAETRRVLAGWAAQYARPDFYNWAVELRETGALIGAVGAVPDEAGRALEPGYVLGRAYWGRGCAAEALRAVARYLFASEGQSVLTCCHALANPASGRVLQKCGFRAAGCGVYHKYDGTAVACRYYQLTKEEFFSHDDRT